jgi:hypothetical protein
VAGSSDSDLVLLPEDVFSSVHPPGGSAVGAGSSGQANSPRQREGGQRRRAKSRSSTQVVRGGALLAGSTSQNAR